MGHVPTRRRDEQSFFYDVELNDGCWKYLSIERIDEHGNYHPEKAIGLVYESKE